MFTNLKTMNHLKIRLLIAVLILLLLNDTKAQIANAKKDSIITQFGFFDGKSYYGPHGGKIYKLNTYSIWAKDLSKSTFDKIVGKEIIVVGEFIKVHGKTRITTNSKGEKLHIPSNDYFSFIINPKFTLIKK